MVFITREIWEICARNRAKTKYIFTVKHSITLHIQWCTTDAQIFCILQNRNSIPGGQLPVSLSCPAPQNHPAASASVRPTTLHTSFHRSGTMQRLCFRDLLSSLRILSSRFTHMAGVSNSFPLKAG